MIKRINVKKTQVTGILWLSVSAGASCKADSLSQK